MARFHGEVGYVDEAIEVSPGVWENNIVEYSYYGDVERNTMILRDGQSVNNDLSVGNSIRIVADAYAREHFFAIRYVRWMGVLWLVDAVEVQHPRLLLRLGSKYDGPTA